MAHDEEFMQLRRGFADVLYQFQKTNDVRPSVMLRLLAGATTRQQAAISNTKSEACNHDWQEFTGGPIEGVAVVCIVCGKLGDKDAPPKQQ